MSTSRWKRLLALEAESAKRPRTSSVDSEAIVVAEVAAPSQASSPIATVLPTVPPDHAENKMQRARRARATNSSKRLSRFGELQPRSAGHREKAAVEMLKITPKTGDDYYRRLLDMDEWRKKEMIDDAVDLPQLTFLSLNYLDHLFWAGEPHGSGEKLVAAIKHFYPELGSQKHLQARLQNGLTGWSKRSPEYSHAPLPINAVFAIIGAMLFAGHHLSACFVLIQFLGYLRPGEVQALVVSQLIPPVSSSGVGQHWCLLLSPTCLARPSKSGEYEESVIFDSNGFEWMSAAIFGALHRNRSPQEMLIPLETAVLLAQWKQAIERLKLDKLEIARYSMRHSGASWDLMERNRTVGDIKARGRWASDSSMKRYLKTAKASDMAHRMGKGVLEYGEQVRVNAQSLFQGLCPLLAPPP